MVAQAIQTNEELDNPNPIPQNTILFSFHKNITKTNFWRQSVYKNY